MTGSQFGRHIPPAIGPLRMFIDGYRHLEKVELLLAGPDPLDGCLPAADLAAAEDPGKLAGRVQSPPPVVTASAPSSPAPRVLELERVWRVVRTEQRFATFALRADAERVYAAAIAESIGSSEYCVRSHRLEHWSPADGLWTPLPPAH
jgi:hypothetical protein